MISCICGLPGKGKNVYATHLALKHYKKTNSSIRRFVRRVLHKEIWINNVYSTYPIRLKKGSKKQDKKPVFSNVVTMFDLNNDFSFEKDSLIIIDETQAFFDSEEYKNFPPSIAMFNQFHRHFDIADIYYISQHPSRIVKKIRVLACEFMKIRHFIRIPLIGLGIMYITFYYEYDDYGKYHHPRKEAKTYDVKNRFVVFFTKSVFKSYNSKYLSVLNEDKPLYDLGEFTDVSMSEDEIKDIFRNRI